MPGRIIHRSVKPPPITGMSCTGRHPHPTPMPPVKPPKRDDDMPIRITRGHSNDENPEKPKSEEEYRAILELQSKLINEAEQRVDAQEREGEVNNENQKKFAKELLNLAKGILQEDARRLEQTEKGTEVFSEPQTTERKVSEDDSRYDRLIGKIGNLSSGYSFIPVAHPMSSACSVQPPTCRSNAVRLHSELEHLWDDWNTPSVYTYDATQDTRKPTINRCDTVMSPVAPSYEPPPKEEKPVVPTIHGTTAVKVHKDFDEEHMDFAAKDGKKYILYKQESNGLWRIRACKDFGTVKKGEFGGLVESESNLSHEGTCWIRDGMKVTGKTRVVDKKPEPKETPTETKNEPEKEENKEIIA